MKKKIYSFDYDLVLLKAYTKSLLIIIGTVIVLSIPMMYLWNWLMPFIFGLPELNLLQIIGLSVLVNMLFSKPPHNTQTATVGVEASSNAVREYHKMRDEMEQSFKK